MMTIWISGQKVQTILKSMVTVVMLLGTTQLYAQERSVADFISYVTEKTGGQLTESQLKQFADAVDKDGDGVISEAEFADRMTAFQSIAAGQPPKEDEDSTDDHAEVKPAEASSTSAVVAGLTGSSDAAVLLISGDEIAEAWIPFATWKTANGKLTKIITVGQIAEQYSADSIQEKIRLCVRDHIDNHRTRWVVLGGDCLPGDKGLVPGGHATVHSQERAGIPTDIVYLSKTSWDADGDGIYGEFKDDQEAISYPDGSVGLGRIPVRTAEDVAAFTEKVVAYESRYPTTDFATQMIYTCTDQPAYPKVRNSWDGYVSKVWEGNMGRFFSKETPWDDGKPGSHQLSAEHLVELFNSKTVSKFHIHGHGHLPAWVLEQSRFTADHVAQLENDGAYPLITTVSCNTGEYDSKKDPSIVERMIRRPGGGSVAIVAPVRTGKPHFASRSDMRLMVTEGKLDGTTMTMTRYWANGLGKGLSTGEAIMSAKAEMAEDARKAAAYHLCICELNLLGDPTLDMRSAAPRKPTLTVPGETAVGKQTVEIVTDAPGSTVCIWKDKEVYQVATADSNGKAVFPVQTSTEGEILVTVSGANLNSESDKIAVVNNTADKSGE